LIYLLDCALAHAIQKPDSQYYYTIFGNGKFAES
jgi:hypothetical protein